MKDIRQAVSELKERLGYPPWLAAIGHGTQDGVPVIVLYLTDTWKPKMPFLDDGWEGYPVSFREHGAFSPLGG